MTNVIKFAHPRRAREEARKQACVWLVKLDTGASDEELQQIRAWMAESEDHVDALLGAASIWDQASMLSELSELFPLEHYSRAQQAWTRAWKHLRHAAAVFMTVTLIGGCFYGWNALERFALRHSSFSDTYETMIGKRSTVSLPDGSEIILNTNTIINVAYSKNARDVTLLRGEGHFTVSKDAERPFKVHVDGNVIEAIGTAFAVQHIREESVEVTVTEGVVSFSTPVGSPSASVTESSENMSDEEYEIPSSPAPLHTIALSAGESVSLNDESEMLEKRKVEPIEMEGRLAWRHGMLLFQGSPLEQVIKEVSRYTTINIEMDESVKDIPVIGYFKTGDIDGLMLTMSETFKVKVEKIREDYIYLSPK